MALASPILGAGTWATFSYVFPEGAATTGLDVGALTTQTDVKCRWTDGSIKHAILTVQNPTAGTHDIVEGADGVSTFTPTYPTASVAFVINGTTYTATLGAFSSLRPWLNGSLVRENRQLVIPVTAEGAEHPLFVVIFDVRMYSDGKYKIDVIVRNTKDVAGAANARLYDIAIVINGVTVYTDADETHYWANVWKKSFYSSGFTPATVTFDFTPFYNARALQRFKDTIASDTWTVTGTDFDDPLGFGGTEPYMPLGGGRSDIGFYPWWEAQFLVHQTANQKARTLAAGDHSGSWSMCVTKDDGESLIRLDEFPDYWFDGRATVGHPNGPNVPREASGALRGLRPDPAIPDNQHIPSVSFVPYMVTGDRYYLDQMKFWAAWSLIATYPGDSTVNGIDFGRQQSMGLLIQNGTRGMAWPLRELADVAAYSPDDDTDKNYFVTCLNNNLEWLDAYHAANSGGISEMPFAERAQPTDDNGYLANAIWQCAYLAYAVDRAIGHGFTAGEAFRNRCIRLQVNFLSHAADGYPQAYGFPYYPRTGKYSNGTSGGTPTLFTTWAQIWGENYDPTYDGGRPYAVRGDLSQPFPNPQPLIGYYDVEGYGLLVMGVREGITGADTALAYLLAQSGVTGDLNARSGFYLEYDVADVPPVEGPGSEGEETTPPSTPPAEEGSGSLEPTYPVPPPNIGPCAQGLGLASGTMPAYRFARPIANGHSILVFVATNSGGAHTAPTDSSGNTYTLIGTQDGFAGFLHISAWLSSNVVGGDDLIVTGHAGSTPDYGIVAWPLYGIWTDNGDVVSDEGLGTTATTGLTASTPPAGSYAFKFLTNYSGSTVVVDSLNWYQPFFSYQTERAVGRTAITNFLPVDEPFEGAWSFSIATQWVGMAFSLLGPTAPELAAPSGLAQSIFARIGETNADDDTNSDEAEAWAPVDGNAGGWINTEWAIGGEFNGAHPWSSRSRFRKLRVIVDLADAEGATCVRTYTIRVNGLDTNLAVTVSGVSSADGTRLTGSNLVDFADLQEADQVVMHRTGSGGSFGRDVTWWTFESINDGNRTSISAVARIASDNGNADYLAPFSWKGDIIETPSRQVNTSINAQSLVCFDGVIDRYDLVRLPTIPDEARFYTFCIYKNGIAQDGTGGTPDTTIVVAQGDTYLYLDGFELSFVTGDYLQVRQTPTSAFNTSFAYAFRRVSTADGVYGFSLDWSSYVGPDDTTSFGGRQQSTGTETDMELILVSPVTIEKMNVLRTGATTPGSGKHAYYRLLINGAVGLECDLTGTDLYNLVTGSVAYEVGDSLVFQFEETAGTASETFIMALSMLGAIVTPSTPTTIATIRRRMRIFNLPFNENRWLFLRRFELFLEAGIGLSTGQGDDPQVMISLSRDGGKTWGPERWVSAGRIGEYEARAFLHQLGRYRNGAMKIVVSDGVPWNLISAFGEIEQGLS